jgi:iron complex outermembrane receptor protein
MDMDNEILYGQDELGNQRNINAPGVSHSGVELEGLIRITPQWTLKGNWTRQHVFLRTNLFPLLAPATTDGKWLFQVPGEMANLMLIYNNEDWGFSADVKYYYVGSRYRINDVFNIAEDLQAAKWGDFSVQQKLWGNEAVVYFGINNFTDRQYALWGTRSSPLTTFNFVEAAWYPNEGRTYYGGIKSSLDFHRMKLPTIADLERMQKRLYGAVNDGVNRFTGMGSWMRNMTPFTRTPNR